MKKRILSLLLCWSMVATTLVGCGGKDMPAKDSKEVEVLFDYPAFWIQECYYSDNTLYLYYEHEYDPTSPFSFDLGYDIDENCKWVKVTATGEGENWTEEGNDVAGQKLADEIITEHNLYEEHGDRESELTERIDNEVDYSYTYGDDPYYDKLFDEMNSKYRDENGSFIYRYDLILKGYSTGEDSATVTEVLLLHTDADDDIKASYGYDSSECYGQTGYGIELDTPDVE